MEQTNKKIWVAAAWFVAFETTFWTAGKELISQTLKGTIIILPGWQIILLTSSLILSIWFFKNFIQNFIQGAKNTLQNDLKTEAQK